MTGLVRENSNVFQIEIKEPKNEIPALFDLYLKSAGKNKINKRPKKCGKFNFDKYDAH